jgi:hypothetical protein
VSRRATRAGCALGGDRVLWLGMWPFGLGLGPVSHTKAMGSSGAQRNSKNFHFSMDLFKCKLNSIQFELVFFQICSNKLFEWMSFKSMDSNLRISVRFANSNEFD